MLGDSVAQHDVQLVSRPRGRDPAALYQAELDFIQFREGVKGSGDAEQMHERKLG